MDYTPVEKVTNDQAIKCHSVLPELEEQVEALRKKREEIEKEISGSPG